mmetsp:Transcript_16049/g.34917  ORF Transcript_16049/g.34917 Transcript_16049/m.34917 type:complete len:132 (-) Transcript_16049:75-470(-)
MDDRTSKNNVFQEESQRKEEFIFQPPDAFASGSGSGSATAYSDSSASLTSSRIGFALIGAGVLSLVVFAVLLVMWRRDRSLYARDRKYSNKKVAPLPEDYETHIVVIEEEQVDEEDLPVEEGSNDNQMQVV